MQKPSTLSDSYLPVILASFALALNIWMLWITNGALYPKMFVISPYAREISSAAGIAGFVVIALFVSRYPSKISETKMILFSLCTYGMGHVIALFGIMFENSALILIGAVCRSFGDRWVIIGIGLGLSFCRNRSLMIGIALSFVLAYLLRIVTSIFTDTTLLIVLGFIPTISYVLVRSSVVKLVTLIQTSESHRNASITYPVTFLPFSHILFISILIFRVVFGFALGLGDSNGVVEQSFLPLVVMVVLATLPLLRPNLRADTLYISCILLVVAGLLSAILIIDSSDRRYLDVVYGFLYGGSECFELLVWYALASVARNNPANSIMVLAWGRAASSIGLYIGVTIAHIFGSVDSWYVMMVGISLTLFVFVAVNVTSLKRVSFDDIIHGVSDESRKNTSDASKDYSQNTSLDSPFDLDERCEGVADRYKLTPREREILGYLARGRNAAYLQETLVLSRNTIKTHVSNIYAKLGVHSQQELIDVVEGAPPPPNH